MTLYRYRITPNSAFGTPMRSDTLYGHLLWAVAERQGEQQVQTMLAAFASSKPPFRLSSALPQGMLPAPVLPPLPRRIFQEQFGREGGEKLFEYLSTFKRFRKCIFVSCTVWQRVKDCLSQKVLFREYLNEPAAFSGTFGINHDQSHNSIDRATGKVLDEGGLHFTHGSFFNHNQALDLYVETDNPDNFEKLFGWVSETGFGADRTSGRGAFSFERNSSFVAEELVGSGEWRMTLSVTSCSDPRAVKGHYKVFVKHGRAWSGHGETSPFKKPFMAFAEGSVFSSLPEMGYVLRNIHPNEKIAQVVVPLTLPFHLEVES